MIGVRFYRENHNSILRNCNWRRRLKPLDVRIDPSNQIRRFSGLDTGGKKILVN
jgi:hypothetical protein